MIERQIQLQSTERGGGEKMKRHKMSRSANKRNFRSGTHVKARNFAGAPMRGGIRL